MAIRSLVPRRAAVVAALLFSFPLAAPAAGCWARTKPLTKTGFGAPASDSRYKRLVNATERAEAWLRADPALNAIAGVRLQVDRSVTLADHDGGPLTAATRLRLHLPEVWTTGGDCGIDQGKADYMNRHSVSVEINTLASISGTLGLSLGDGSVPEVAMHPDAAALLARSGAIRADADAGNTVMKGARLDGKPLVVPVTVREHLAHWERALADLEATGELASLRAHRARLSASMLGASAWSSPEAIAERMWGYRSAPSEGASPLYQIAPDLLTPTRDEGEVRFIVVRTDAPGDEGDEIATALRRWIESLDRDAIVAIAGEGGR